MKSFIVASLVALTAAAPAVVPRSTYCQQWDSEVAGIYTVYNNLWGESAATSGSQCTSNNGVSNNVLSWSTSWSWAGGNYNVKSFANAVASVAQKSLSSISSMPTTWKWSYTGSGIVADVAYDLFTSSSASGSAEYEIMVWLGSLGGAGPISSSGSPIATPTLSGVTWNLFEGPNGAMSVFSFVAQSNVESFTGDLSDFTDYLVSSQGVSGSQILQSIGAGTEPFIGSNAVFTTSAYSVAVN